MNENDLPEGLNKIVGSENGPVVVLFKQTHGNEIGGAKVLDLIMEDLVGISQGTLIYGIGNLEASKLNVRSINSDLNRAYGKKVPLGSEGNRVIELKPILQNADYFFDIHSYINPGDPVICYPGNDFEGLKSLTKYIPIKNILYGDGLWPPNRDSVYGDTYVCSHKGKGMTIETGHLSDMTHVESTASGLAKILENILGATFTKNFQVMPSEKKYWHAYEHVPADEGFTFEKIWGNFEFLPKGTKYATSLNKEYIVNCDSYILFAKSQENIVLGNEVCILLEEEEEK